MTTAKLEPSIIKKYKNIVKKYGISNAKMNFVYAEQMRDADETVAADAREKLICGNIGLALRCAHSFVHFHNVDFDDAIQYSMEGLIHHVDRYDPELGFTFSTYVTTGLRRWVGRSISQNENAIRVPVHFSVVTAKIVKARDEIVGRGIAPTPEAVLEQAVKNGLSEEYASIDIVRKAMATYQLGSLISTFNRVDCEESEGSILQDMLECDKQVRDYQDWENEVEVDRLLGHLLPGQRKALVMRFGLEGTDPVPSSVVAEVSGTSRQNEDAKIKVAIKKICKKEGIEFVQSKRSKDASERMKKHFAEGGVDIFGDSRGSKNRGSY